VFSKSIRPFLRIGPSTLTRFRQFMSYFITSGLRLLPLVMKADVIRTGKGNEVFWSIVPLVPIDVVYPFVREQLSTIGLFPNKAMLKNITCRISKVVFRHPYHPVSQLALTSAFPTAATLPAKMVSFQVAHWLTCYSPVSSGTTARNRRRLPAATFTDARRNIVRVDGDSLPSIHLFPNFLNSQMMRGQKSRKSIFVMRLPGNLLTAAAFTNVHVGILLPS
jgi:hypothetical protein